MTYSEGDRVETRYYTRFTHSWQRGTVIREDGHVVWIKMDPPFGATTYTAPIAEVRPLGLLDKLAEAASE